MKKVLGVGLVSSPFLAITAISLDAIGLWPTILMWAVVFAFFLVIAAGMNLVAGEPIAGWREDRKQAELEARVMESELPNHPRGNDEEPARITGTRYLSSKAWHR